jgi:hypothetical protein
MIKKRNLLAGDREGDHEANPKPIKGFVPPPSPPPVTPSVRSASGARGLAAKADRGPLPTSGLLFFSWAIFQCLLQDVGATATSGGHNKFLLPFPHTGVACSARGWRMELCVLRIS